MKEFTTQVFQIEDLEGEARENAISNMREIEDTNPWDSEWSASLSRGVEELGLEYARWPRDGYYLADSDVADLSGIRAWKWVQNNLNPKIWTGNFCPTGFCGDYSFYNPLADFMEFPDSSTLGDIFSECAGNLMRDWEKDREWLARDEQLLENAILNEVEFLKDGSLF